MNEDRNNIREMYADHASIEALCSRYFKMGAVVALGELLNESDLLATAQQRRLVRRFLASFGVTSMKDVESLGVKGVYKYSFEHLYS